ncbi:lytic transglycosylase domain-containing protein [Clostridium uliginosum]|uniref:Transglycosylase SLT domain-containing protein n=1 Tax=Clostridium uliginosum TaxID=119641 RepID=A0A1I1J6G3_9CLOT|nr:lytic transglycosylase domain-containing protein [Clostridium uliginosum]SFC44046.1 Transglycosylase SLT domain-containing protein [Clostridium uliginosum]
MGIDSLSTMSKDQLLALESNKSYSDDNNSEDGLQFALVMKALMDNSKKTSEGNEKLQGMQSLQNTQTTPGQRLDYMQMILNDNSNSINNTSISSLASQTNDDTMKKIYSAVDEASKRYGVNSNLILGIIKQESDFNPTVTSGAGAMGLMQLMPENCKEDGVNDAYDIEQNVQGGVKQLKGYIDKYNGDIAMALMAYNAGPGTMQKRGVSSAENLYKMPKETQDYVPKVMSYYKNGI